MFEFIFGIDTLLQIEQKIIIFYSEQFIKSSVEKQKKYISLKFNYEQCLDVGNKAKKR